VEWTKNLLSQKYLNIDRYNHSEGIALFDADAGLAVSYPTLWEEIERLSPALSSDRKALAFHICTNTVDDIIAYLATVAAGHVAALLDGGLTNDKLSRLLQRYKPEWVVCHADKTNDYSAELSVFDQVINFRSLKIFRKSHAPVEDISLSLALLLSTSGSTGSPKFVRLSQKNLESNAYSIAQYLGIERDHRAIVSLPMHYSYGLSVINSHLCAGASLVITDGTLMEKTFWDVFAQYACSSFAGVPYSYAMLERVGFSKKHYPALRYMTQAGGKLEDHHVRRYYDLLSQQGKRFYVMYGQTEASPRMCYLPFESLPQKIGSVGVAIPGGKISIDPGTREVIYQGPNVMLGYAHCRHDLAAGDDLQGVLRTGDIGYQDDDGYLYITGRSKRIGKVYGVRLNLDEVESLLHCHGPAAVISKDGDKIGVFCEFQTEDDYAAVARELAIALSTHWSAFDFHHLESLPVNASGKIDYGQLENSM